jgi:hypothetical protein
MLKLSDRIKQKSSSQGFSDLSLDETFRSFQPFSVIGDGNSTYYTIENGINFEVGIGTYDATQNVLSRDLVLDSNNNKEKINIVGPSIVFCTYPATLAVFLDTEGYATSQVPPYSGIKFPDGTIQTTAAIIDPTNITKIYESTTLTISDDIIFVYCDDNDINLTLPSAENIGGKKIQIKKISGEYTVNIIPQNDEMIDNYNSFSIFTNFEAIKLISDNSNWFLF